MEVLFGTIFFIKRAAALRKGERSMKFTINREEFLKGIMNAGRVTQNKVDPILSNLKLDLFEFFNK